MWPFKSKDPILKNCEENNTESDFPTLYEYEKLSNEQLIMVALGIIMNDRYDENLEKVLFKRSIYPFVD